MSSARTAERATIIDVARVANVSFATVSRVVTGKGYVSSATRERVVEAMARTGYVVNREARALAGGRHQVIGLLVPDLDTSYVGEILRGIDEELAAASYDLMLYTTHRRKTRESEFVRSLSQSSTDGLLMILPMDPEAYAESIQRRDFPYVIVDHTGVDEQGPAVGTTNRLGAIEATRYLLSLGHRRIGFITGIPEMGCAQERRVGYQEALLAAGLRYDAALVQEGNFRQPLAYECTRRLLALPEPPTAIFAANDISAYGVMDAVRDAGLRIPDHVSVVGFDDIPSSLHSNPPLTTIRQPMREMGRLAARMLFELIENPKRGVERIDLPTELVIRSTCRPMVEQ